MAYATRLIPFYNLGSNSYLLLGVDTKYHDICPLGGKCKQKFKSKSKVDSDIFQCLSREVNEESQLLLSFNTQQLNQLDSSCPTPLSYTEYYKYSPIYNYLWFVNYDTNAQELSHLTHLFSNPSYKDFVNDTLNNSKLNNRLTLTPQLRNPDYFELSHLLLIDLSSSEFMLYILHSLKYYQQMLEVFANDSSILKYFDKSLVMFNLWYNNNKLIIEQTYDLKPSFDETKGQRLSLQFLCGLINSLSHYYNKIFDSPFDLIHHLSKYIHDITLSYPQCLFNTHNEITTLFNVNVSTSSPIPAHELFHLTTYISSQFTPDQLLLHLQQIISLSHSPSKHSYIAPLWLMYHAIFNYTQQFNNTFDSNPILIQLINTYLFAVNMHLDNMVTNYNLAINIILLYFNIYKLINYNSYQLFLKLVTKYPTILFDKSNVDIHNLLINMLTHLKLQQFNPVFTLKFINIYKHLLETHITPNYNSFIKHNKHFNFQLMENLLN